MRRFALLLFGLLLLIAAAPADGQEKGKKKGGGTGYVPLTPAKRAYYRNLSHVRHGARIDMLVKNQILPPTFDCRDRYPLPIWDQASCGSCYLVSTVRTATCSLGLAGYGKPDNSFLLAVQYGMDSPRDFGGCGGGNGTEVIDWMIKHGWPAEKYTDAQGVAHVDYPPYEAQSGRDRTKPGAKMWMKDATWGFVAPGDAPPTVDQIKAAMVNYGRLNIALDAGGQFMNGVGTITALGSSIDHEINVCAYDDTHDNGDGTKGAVLLENQWNTDWGNNGVRWCSYRAAKNIVDWFFVSVTPLPPPPPPPNLVPPFSLYDGASLLTGSYPDLPSATAAGKLYADANQVPVTVKDSKGVLAATVLPTPVIPPPPPTPPPPPPPPPDPGPPARRHFHLLPFFPRLHGLDGWIR